MPWKETSPMNERMKFVAAMLEAEEGIAVFTLLRQGDPHL